MKYLLGVYICLIIAVAVVAAQQDIQPRQTPSIQPTAEALMKAQAAADKAQAKREEPSTEELKKLVEREIARSAALPVTEAAHDPIPQSVQANPSDPAKGKNKQIGFLSGLVLIDGALYIRVGNSVLPAPGGGASGCFSTSVENDAKIQRAQAKFAEMTKAEPAKKD